MAKIKWKVQDAPTGPYRSFGHWGWPVGTVDGEHAFSIHCKDAYTPARARGEQPHAPLTLHVADRRDAYKDGKGAWVLRKMKGEFASLLEAKLAAQLFLDAQPDVFKVVPRA